MELRFALLFIKGEELCHKSMYFLKSNPKRPHIAASLQKGTYHVLASTRKYLENVQNWMALSLAYPINLQLPFNEVQVDTAIYWPSMVAWKQA